MTKFKQGVFHLLTIFSLLTLASCGGGDSSDGIVAEKKTPVTTINPSTINFIPHLSFGEKVSLIFPESWKKQDSNAFGAPEIIAAFSEPPEGPSDRFLENVLLIKVDSMQEVRGTGVNSIKEISSKQVEIAGFIGEESIFDADVAGVEHLDLRFMEIAFEFNGSAYGLIYSAERDVFERNTNIVRYMASNLNIGQVVFDNLNATSDLSNPGKPAVASSGTGFLVVSCRESDTWPYPSELIGRIVKVDRSMSSEFQIHADENSPAGTTRCSSTRYNTIFDGANYLVTYITKLDGNHRIVGKRITPTGNLIDIAPIDISKNSSTSVRVPDLVFDGNRTLVVWSEKDTTQSLKGAFIEQTGGVTDSFLIVDNVSDMFLNANYSLISPQVAYGDNQFMVIWSPYFFENTRRDNGTPIFGQVLNLNGGTLLPEPIQIRSDSGDNPRYPQIASDGTNYLIGWIEGLLETNTIRAGSFKVYARQVNSAGELVGSIASDTGITISDSVLVTDNVSKEVPKSFLDLSYNDGSYLFLWASTNFDPATGVYGAKLSQNLESISETAPITGLKRDTFFGDFYKPSQVNVSNLDTRNFILWSSQSGELEGWFIEADHFQ
jgi:hypothetical protein